MNLDQLKYFIATIDNKSINKASQELFLSHTALLKSLSNLEKELHCQLISRSNKGVAPTPIGEVIYKDSQMLLTLIDRYKQKWKHLSAKSFNSNEVIGIGYSPFIETYILTDLILSLQENYPGMHYALCEANTTSLLESLENEKLHLIIIPMLDFNYSSPEQTFILDYLIRKVQKNEWSYQIILQTDLVYLLNSQHPLLADSSADISITQYPLVVFQSEPHFNKLYERINQRNMLFFNSRMAFTFALMQNALGLSGAKPTPLPFSNLQTLPLSLTPTPQLHYYLIYSLALDKNLLLKDLADKITHAYQI